MQCAFDKVSFLVAFAMTIAGVDEKIVKGSNILHVELIALAGNDEGVQTRQSG